jgi:hypothetical protein
MGHHTLGQQGPTFHARRTGLWIAVAIPLALGTGAQAAQAKECHNETPLPADVTLIAPGPDVSQSVAEFAGAWVGAWMNRRGEDTLCQTLVVEEVLPKGHARVIYSHGTHEAGGIRQPKFWRATGRVVDGVLRFRLPVPERPDFVYRFDGQALSSTFKGEGRARLTRFEDVSRVGCRRQPGDRPVPPAAGTPRERLTADELHGPLDPTIGPVHNDYFLPVGQAGPALHAFRGTLFVGAFRMASGEQGCAGLPTPASAFSAMFFSHGEHLVPVIRDILQPPGTVIISPGRVWSEPGDGGWSRASFPFVLVDPLGNAARNGLATFLYDDTRVSALRFQIVQETHPWSRTDYWGQVAMAYVPGAIADEAASRARYAEELKQEVPIKPWSSLPASAGAVLAVFDGDASPEDISASGLIVGGVVHVRGCNTRYGPFPYCRHMRHGVFSVTKSMGAAVALLRLAQKYGDAVLGLKIKDYVQVTATHDGWERVTFADALNMATGIGDNAPEREPPAPHADEQKPKMFEWARARTAREKLDRGFTYGKYPWAPGEILRYNTTHTFVLAAAMDSFLKRQVGPQAHLWDMVVEEVFRPIGIFHAPTMHTLEADGSRGIPLLGYGLFPTIDDVAKLATLFQNGGRHEGRQLLSAAKVAEALYRTAATGLPTGGKNRFGDARYHLSFWSVPYRTHTGCFFQIPYMSGLGGNLVVLLPNGTSAFRFADGHNYDVESMVPGGEALRPFCPPSAAGPAPPHPGPRLTESELRAELAGKTFRTGRQELSLEAGGRLYGTIGDDFDVGTWQITPDGRYWRTWNVWDGRRPRCYTVHRAGETLEIYVEGRWGKFVLERR